MEDSDKPNNEVLVLKQLKSIKVALWTLVTVFVIIPVVAGIGTGLVIGFMALTAPDPSTANTGGGMPDSNVTIPSNNEDHGGES